MHRQFLAPAAALLLLAACNKAGTAAAPADDSVDAQGHVAPSAATIARNRAVLQALPFQDRADFDDAQRGLIAADPQLQVRRADDGRTLWDMGQYAFVKGEAPDSVNPSLWRQAQLNDIHGLFKVADGIYQLRGYDVSNISLIEGATGWIVVDPLTGSETAGKALDFARQHLGPHKVSAVIFTHSHIDHFGGIGAVLPPDQAAGVRIVAPKGFIEEATSENLIAGIGMGRRAAYMYGQTLARGPRGHVDTGLGKGIAFGGHVGIRVPTDIVDHSGQELDLDGVHFVFQYVPDSEAPDELTFRLPQKKAYCGAEVLSHTLHNLYTLRGAKVRDGLLWSRYIDEAIGDLGDTEVYFASHQWPLWGNARIRQFMVTQRDTYKYIHDQAVHLANSGYSPEQIAERITLPDSLSHTFWNRGYYGTVKHNSRAVYQRYFGFYDSNPAHLDPLPPEQSGAKYVALMGGAPAVLAQAQKAYDAGEYRWVAELLNHLVFAEPGNAQAKELLARAYDQLGYQAESGPWRDEYLSAADELRHGIAAPGVNPADAIDLLRQTPPGLFFDSMAATLDGPAAADKRYTINFVFTDLNQTQVLSLENGVLHHHQQAAAADANATVYLTHELFLDLILGKAGLKETLFSDSLRVEGSRIDLLRFLTLFKRPDGKFAIVTPQAS